MYYYAVLDERGIVINLTSSQTALTGTNLVSITSAQYNDPDSIMGMYYSQESGTFIIPPVSVVAETSTSNIQYKAEEKWLDEKLDEIEDAIENNPASAFEGYLPSSFAASGHSHSNASSSANGFMEKEDKAAFDTAKNRGQIGNAKNITKTGEDLDNYIYPGVYTFAASYAPAHIPAGNNGWLVVLRWPTSDANATVKQFWLRHGSAGVNDFETYARTKLGTNPFGSWSKFYTTSNPPTAAEVGAVDKSLQMTADNGDVSVSWTNQDIVSKILALPSGIHTAYARSNTTGNPKTTESFRYIVHKTGSASYGWVQAFGSYGSMYTGYVDNGTWKGWKCIYDAAPGRLWSGAKLVKANETITPSKKLSECRTGWMLLWSDYDPDTSSGVEGDFVTTFIPNRNHLGSTWNGSTFFADIPRFIGSNTQDTSTEKRIIKWFNVYDDKITGTAANGYPDRDDVALRAIYEF